MVVEDMELHGDKGGVIRRVLQRLVAEYAPRRVILYGSYARGEPGPDSDIDLLIVKETSARFLDRWTSVQRILSGTHHAIPVDALVLTPEELEARLARGDLFLAEILEKGEVLYAA